MRTNKNFIVISDIHLDNWPRNSPEKDFRMRKQPLMLAKRLSVVMREQDTNYLFILGDIINQWSASPQIMEVLVDFYKSLIEENPDIVIGYILGQHDMRLYDDYGEDNSYVHLVARMFPKNVFYMHDKYLNLNGTEIYLSSYNRKDILYPKKPVNIFLSHISFGFVDVDKNAADLIIAGDIHDFYDEGNCHSVGLPFQLYSHQPRNGVIGIVSCNGTQSTFRRIPSDSPEFEFLKLDPITRRSIKKSEEVEELKLDSSDIMRMIEDEVKKHGIEDIHREIPLNNLPTPVNFKFQLKKLIIDNVRSIDHLELDLENLTGVNYVKGPTGSGKSTVFRSIIAALVGTEREERYFKANKFTGKPLRLQLSLEYEGHEYYIDRSAKELKFFIDGKQEQFGKRDTQKRILEALPFANYWQYFYIRANNHYFDSINKTELMRVLFNLKIFDYLFNESKQLIKANNAKTKQNREALVAEQSKLTYIQGKLAECEESLKNFEDLTQDIKDIDAQIVEERRLVDELVSVTHDLTRLSTEKNVKQNIIGGPSVAPESYIKTKIEKYTQDRENALKRIIELSTANDEFEKWIKAKERCEMELKLLRAAKVEKCPHCGGILKGLDEERISYVEGKLTDLLKEEHVKSDENVLDELRKQVSEAEQMLKKIEDYKKAVEAIDRLSSQIESVSNKKTEIEQKLQNIYSSCSVNDHAAYMDKMMALKSRLSEKNNYLKLHKTLSGEVEESTQKCASYNAIAQECESRGAQILKYNELFNIQELSSIPYSILSKLVKYLNTETVKFESSLNGEDFNITASIQVGDGIVAYEEASDGQKNYLDMFILIRISKFLNGLGLIIMDEPLTNLDPSYIDEASRLIPEIAANTIFISSHTRFDGYDRLIDVKQNEHGITEVSLS